MQNKTNINEIDTVTIKNTKVMKKLDESRFGLIWSAMTLNRNLRRMDECRQKEIKMCLVSLET